MKLILKKLFLPFILFALGEAVATELQAIQNAAKNMPFSRTAILDAEGMGFTLDQVREIIQGLPLETLRIKYHKFRSNLEKHVYFIVTAEKDGTPLKLYVKFKMSPQNNEITLLSFHRESDQGHIARAEAKKARARKPDPIILKKAS